MRLIIYVVSVIIFCSTQCIAGEADITEVKVEKMGDDRLIVYATVQHDDEGWEHYADRWEILDENGRLLDTRILLHPHSAAPFTRSLPAAKIPPGIKKIKVRAHDNRHGYGGREIITEISES